MKKIITLLAILFVSITATNSFAEKLQLFVAEMSTTGVQNSSEMKMTLQTLLASRLNGDKIVTVGSASEANIIVTGSYISIGKTFSIDAIAKNSAGKIITRDFVQGKNEDELIPAVGVLAEKMATNIVKEYSANKVEVTASAIVVPTAGVNNLSYANSESNSDFIKPQHGVEQSKASDWISERLNGAANLMALGSMMQDGRREIFLAEAHKVSYYRQGTDMQLVADEVLSAEEKIVSLDTIDNAEGGLDIYATVIRAGEPLSKVWQVKDNRLTLIAEKLPYYFRSAGIAGGPKKLYAQEVGREDDFYGDVAEVTRNKSVVHLGNTIKMPRYGTIYSFNQFYDRNGKLNTVVLNPDGYLIVYDQNLSEIWRSSDTYGGSELYFQKESIADLRVTGSPYRWVFMNQRIQVSSKGELLIGKNDGFWTIGNMRSYKKGSVHCLIWNGSSLEEKWHTRETENYMPDYFYDESRNELLILQAVQRPGIKTSGATSLSIKKVE